MRKWVNWNPQRQTGLEELCIEKNRKYKTLRKEFEQKWWPSYVPAAKNCFEMWDIAVDFILKKVNDQPMEPRDQAFFFGFFLVTSFSKFPGKKNFLKIKKKHLYENIYTHM